MPAWLIVLSVSLIAGVAIEALWARAGVWPRRFRALFVGVAIGAALFAGFAASEASCEGFCVASPCVNDSACHGGCRCFKRFPEPMGRCG